jgi:hypothetical protein
MDDKADLIGNYKRVHSAPCKLEFGRKGTLRHRGTVHIPF